MRRPLLVLPALLLVVGLAAPAWAATPTLVQHVWSDHTSKTAAERGGDANGPLTFWLPAASQANNALVLAFTHEFQSGVTITITDDKGNTWSSIAGPVSDAEHAITERVYGAFGVAAGTQQITVQFSVPVLAFQAHISEWFNVATASATDGSSTNNASTSPTITAGTFTPGTSGDLILHWSWCTTWGTSAGTTTWATGFTAGTGFTLLATSQYLGGMVQYQVQSVAAAINPSITISGTDGDAFNSVAIALKSASAGSQGAAFRIAGIHHLRANNGTSTTVNVPTIGNLEVLATSYDIGSNALSAVSSSPANTWTIPSTTTYQPQFAYAENVTSATTMTMTLTLGVAEAFPFLIYDVVGALAASFDQMVTHDSGNSSGDADFTHSPDFTPAQGNELVIVAGILGTGPVSGLVSPFVSDMLDYGPVLTTTGDVDTTTTLDGLAASPVANVKVGHSVVSAQGATVLPGGTQVASGITSTSVVMTQAGLANNSGNGITFGGKTDSGPDAGDAHGHYLAPDTSTQNWIWHLRNGGQLTGHTQTALGFKGPAIGGPPASTLMGVGQ
jgi:hypothetical protein